MKQPEIVIVIAVISILLYAFRPARRQELAEPQKVSFVSRDNITKKFLGGNDHSTNGLVSVDERGNKVITWDVSGNQEQQLVGIMQHDVGGITKEEAKKLIMIRLSFNWMDVPSTMRGDDIEGIYCYQLKHQILDITTNIAEALNAPIGDVRYPPRMDLEIRDSMSDEIKAIAGYK